jgi:hypothetical protein
MAPMSRTELVPESLRGQWAQWVGGQPWDLLLTVTSERQTHPEAMLKRTRYLMNIASDHVYGKHWDRRGTGIQWLAGLERTKQGWPHSHVLMRFPDFDLCGPQGKAVFPLAYWHKKFSDGGFVKFDIPRSTQAVVAYVTKYVVKDGDLHWSANCTFPAPPPQVPLLPG